jgi:epoxyqueuosine reductase
VTPERRALLLKGFATSLGFDGVGITDLSPPPHTDALSHWLASGMAATMTYMQRQSERRLAPSTIVPGATRAIVVTRNYFTADSPPVPGTGRVAKYARGADYHRTLRQPLEHLAKFAVTLGGADTIARCYVDAGPVPERELAQRAGLGWIGKNTMLLRPRDGSFFFLASVLTNLELALDPPFMADRCGTCRRCLDACPTTALPDERVLDARRCISYLTIEHHGEVPVQLHPLIGGWLFGCDICQDVCPWNRKATSAAADSTLALDPTLEQLDLDALLGQTKEEFERRFGATPLTRPGLSGVQRNARIVRRNLSGA